MDKQNVVAEQNEIAEAVADGGCLVPEMKLQIVPAVPERLEEISFDLGGGEKVRLWRCGSCWMPIYGCGSHGKTVPGDKPDPEKICRALLPELAERMRRALPLVEALAARYGQ